MRHGPPLRPERDRLGAIGKMEGVSIAHLAIGSDARQLEVGSFQRSARTVKWNEAPPIEETLRPRARFAGSCGASLHEMRFGAAKSGWRNALSIKSANCEPTKRANIIESIVGAERTVFRNAKRWRSPSMAMRCAKSAMTIAKGSFGRSRAHKQLPPARRAMNGALESLPCSFLLKTQRRRILQAAPSVPRISATNGSSPCISAGMRNARRRRYVNRQ